MGDTFPVKRGGGLISPNIMLFPEEATLEGLRGGDLWGRPLGRPVHSSWHPRMKEHEQIVWMTVMHLLRAVERTGGL